MNKNKITIVGEIEKKLDKEIPVDTAESWDNVGLLVGDREKQVHKILVALDATENIVNEAIDKNVDLIVTHHPIIFGGLKSVTKESCSNIYKLIENDISVYSAHTNFDKLDVGTSAVLAEKLNLKDIETLTIKGFGKIGDLDRPIIFRSYVKLIKEVLGLENLILVGELNKKIKRVAICAGSGSEFLQVAKEMGADLYISGDVTYHNAQKAVELGINWVDATHYASEYLSMSNLKQIVEEVTKDTYVEILLSEINDQPFKLV